MGKTNTQSETTKNINLVLRPMEIYIGKLNARRKIIIDVLADAADLSIKTREKIQKTLSEISLEIITVAKTINQYRDVIDSILA